MKKIIEIDGMSCGHCKAKVESALSALPGVSAKVDLKNKQAVVRFEGGVSDEALADAVAQAGYEVVGIRAKKGLFGR